MTGENAVKVGDFWVFAKRRGIRGEYAGYIEGIGEVTTRFRGTGAKEKAFEAAVEVARKRTEKKR